MRPQPFRIPPCAAACSARMASRSPASRSRCTASWRAAVAPPSRGTRRMPMDTSASCCPAPTETPSCSPPPAWTAASTWASSSAPRTRRRSTTSSPPGRACSCPPPVPGCRSPEWRCRRPRAGRSPPASHSCSPSAWPSPCARCAGRSPLRGAGCCSRSRASTRSTPRGPTARAPRSASATCAAAQACTTGCARSRTARRDPLDPHGAGGAPMPLIRVEAVILQSFAYSETSKILLLATRTHGARSAIARGALRPRSRFGGVLEPFTEGVATLYVKEGRDLHTLSSFDLTRTRQELGADLRRFGGASLIAELVIRAAREEADQALYDQIRGAFARIARASEERLDGVLLAETWALVGRLGFTPSIDGCAACGRPLAEDEDAFFDYDAGGVLCAQCARPGPVRGSGRVVPAAARRVLACLTQGNAVEIERPAAHWALLHRFITRHVADGATLRSLPFLVEALESR